MLLLCLFQSKTFKNKLYGENDIPLMCVDHIYGGNNCFLLFIINDYRSVHV